jgi:hypothetical protein
MPAIISYQKIAPLRIGFACGNVSSRDSAIILLALEQIANFREQHFLFRQCRRLRRLRLQHTIHQLDHEEQDPSDDDEVDDDGDEISPRQNGALLLGFDQSIRADLQ